jgi:hypothetical protein
LATKAMRALERGLSEAEDPNNQSWVNQSAQYMLKNVPLVNSIKPDKQSVYSTETSV